MARPFDPDVLLGAPLMAHLGTVSPEGPRISPVWYIWEEGVLWMLGTTGSGAVRRLAQDPRASVEITRLDVPSGQLLHLGLRGRARVLAMTRDRFERLLARYLGPDPAQWNRWFIDEIARIDDPEGRWIALMPDSVFTNNVSYFRTGPDLAWP